MTEATKAKIKVTAGKIWRGVKDNIFPIFCGATIGAAWGGWKMGRSNHRRLDELEAKYNRAVEVIDNNATCQSHDRDRMLELEHRQNELFERALKETEGKTE